jgi:hypothetical protein
LHIRIAGRFVVTPALTFWRRCILAVLTETKGGNPRLELWEESDKPVNNLRAIATRLPTPVTEFLKSKFDL